MEPLSDTSTRASCVQPASHAAVVVNAITVDVEDYFHVSAFDGTIDRRDWDRFETRVCGNTDRLLEIFDRAGVSATFFVLGWVAERFPALVRRIAANGHEVGSHGFDHRLVYAMTPAQFRADLRRSRAALEGAIGQGVRGYRAPSFSITADAQWALDVLIEEGFLYDSSIFPIRHDRYGIPDAPRHPHTIRRSGGTIWEFPASTVRYAGVNLPVAGGGYFRLLPYAWTKWGIQRLNAVERQPAIVYLHPWEIDPDQPRVGAPLVTRLRHYGNLSATYDRLARLLGEFPFGPLHTIIGTVAHGALASGAAARDTLRVPVSAAQIVS